MLGFLATLALSAAALDASADPLTPPAPAAEVTPAASNELGSALLATPDDRLTWNPAVDISVTAGLWVAWVVSESVLKTPLAPTTCRTCGTNGFDNAFRSLFNPTFTPSAEGNKAADGWSNIVTYGFLPAAIFTWEIVHWLTRSPEWRNHWKEPLIDVLLGFEAVGAALMVTQVVKFAVGRARPFTIGATTEMIASGKPTDAFLSFFSGHSTLGFSAAAAITTIAQLRGYKHWWVIAAVTFPVAATIGILRMAADKHWASDVLVGMAVGTAAGILIPRLFHQRRTIGQVTMTLVPAGQGLSLVGTF